MAGPQVPSSFQEEAFSHLDISDTVNSETGNDEKMHARGHETNARRR